MIPLVLPAASDALAPFVTRLRLDEADAQAGDSVMIAGDGGGGLFAGAAGLVEVIGAAVAELDGDVILVEPSAARAERLVRASSDHNTLLITERCDQLCVMCSQPPKKTHVDRFASFEAACLLAPEGALLGVSGGEPTLYKAQLLAMLERVLERRADLSFHILSNAQHFEDDDVARLTGDAYRRVTWGIPLYATQAALHDRIVGKVGAFEALEAGLARLALAGARVELRTVVLRDNLEELPALARYAATRLRFVEAWSIMQLEHIGFAKARWSSMFVNHRLRFVPIAEALDHAVLHGVAAQLFNMPRCTVPPDYRSLARASISDWKRKFAPQCGGCSEREQCSGFFEWHPDEEAMMVAAPL